ncbi:MAG: thioredoxin domain-containing protein [Acidobacteria bacterium]|nr:thioredoxin domain-containing protein [Acidobacteriota bacterium]
MKTRLFAALLAAFALTAIAQQPTQFQDTSMLKPPAGAKVAVVEFEDLECPACANAAPIVHRAVEQYHIPLVRYDFPLKAHVWSFDAAVYARWMQEKVNPSVADQYRAAVFANQMSIASKDDLAHATRKFLADRKIQMPFQVDPTGALANKVRADYALGEKLGIQHTPTIVVVTQNHYDELTGDPNQIYGKIEAALAATRSSTSPVKKSATKK